MRWVFASVLVVALLTAPRSAPATAQAPDSGRNQIVTNGTGRVDVAPTQAIVTVGVQAQRNTAAEASAEVSRVAEQILNRLQQLGIRRQDIRTSGVQLHPVFTSPRDGSAPQISGYRALYTLTLTLNDLRQVGPAIDESTKAGANLVQGVSFGLRDDSMPRREALTAAVREARAKADAIAQAAGLQIRGIERIVEEGVEVQFRAERAVPAPMAPGQVPTPIEPGLVTVTARVSMVFNF
ncbi:MAG: SIMPL domain-containing protein [Acidimicrobiia bacterium]